MKPRCDGRNYRTFLCVLDEGHDEACEPYQPPDADQFRLMTSLLNLRRDTLRKPGVPRWTASIPGVARGDGHTPMAAICALAERVDRVNGRPL